MTNCARVSTLVEHHFVHPCSNWVVTGGVLQEDAQLLPDIFFRWFTRGIEYITQSEGIGEDRQALIALDQTRSGEALSLQAQQAITLTRCNHSGYPEYAV